MPLPVPFPSSYLIQRNTSIGYLRNLWLPSSFDYDVWEDSFVGAALDVRYPAVKSNGAGALRTFTATNANHFLELISGTAADGYAGTGMDVSYTGSRGVLLEAVIRTPAAITSMKFEVGFSDSNSANAGVVNVKATPSFNATDGVVAVFDTTDTATGLAFVGVQNTTATGGGDISGVTVAASTTYVVAVRIDGANASLYWNGVQVGQRSNAVTAATKLTPWVFCQGRAGSASRTLQLHKWRVTQPAY